MHKKLIFVICLLFKGNTLMADYTPQWPHGPINEIFPNIFFVTGTNKTTFEGFDFQTSRNMVILREGKDLTLINTVRLTDKGLAELEKLGTVKNIMRIGAFHGRDDQFYRDRYKATYWEPGDKKLPISAELFSFKSDKFKEAALLLPQNDGILITCDSIQNWTMTDEFFNEQTRIKFFKEGKIRSANIGDPWKHAAQPQNMQDLLKLKFKHLLSAHGEPMLDKAHELIRESIDQEYTYKTLEKNLLFDDKGRRIPVILYGEENAKGLVLISHGYKVNHSRYRFLARHFIKKGYRVASVQHEIEGDSELPPVEKRAENWARGVATLKYVKDQLKAEKVILIGHSNGGDMSVRFGHTYPEEVSHIISLDSLRATMPETAPYKMMTLRAADTYADPGVLPSKGVKIIPVKGEHNQLYDKASEALKAEILEHIDAFLRN